MLLAGQGCCSYHQGECGCSVTGETVCCDGSTSPTCTCGGYNQTLRVPSTPTTSMIQRSFVSQPIQKTEGLNISYETWVCILFFTVLVSYYLYKFSLWLLTKLIVVRILKLLLLVSISLFTFGFITLFTLLFR